MRFHLGWMMLVMDWVHVMIQPWNVVMILTLNLEFSESSAGPHHLTNLLTQRYQTFLNSRYVILVNIRL